MKRVHLFVSGRVQGVFFRAECESMARSLGLAGFVHNLPDGRVEAAFEGSDLDVEAAVGWCRRGPALAQVESVDVSDAPLRGDGGFRAI